MKCVKCLRDIPDNSIYCNLCGKKQIKEQGEQKKHKRRANGEGSVFPLPNGKYRADKTLYYIPNVNGRPTRKTRSRTFIKRSDAVLWLGEKETVKVNTITLKETYDKCMETYKAERSTINGYNAGMAVFKSLWNKDMAEITIDEIQDCVDNCGRGKRTKEDAKTALGITYKWAIPRKYVDNRNLAQFIRINEKDSMRKTGISDEGLAVIQEKIGTLPTAEIVYCHCYLGFRPTEFLGLQIKDYNPKEKCFVAGIKTEAGKNRTVTISPKIQPYIDARIEGKAPDDYVFCNPDTGGVLSLKKYRALFYELLDECGIKNPNHAITPHSCRHTFATLMKRVDGAEKDKLALIGHTESEQLRDYQDVAYADLRKITDRI